MAPGAAPIHSWLSTPSMANPSSSSTAAALARELPSCSECTSAEMPPAATKVALPTTSSTVGDGMKTVIGHHIAGCQPSGAAHLKSVLAGGHVSVFTAASALMRVPS